MSEDATDNPEDECDLSNDDTVNYRDLNGQNLYKAEQAAPETTKAVLEDLDLDCEDALEPPHHYCNIRADTLYTTVSD